MALTVHDPSVTAPASGDDPFPCDQVYAPLTGHKDVPGVEGSPYPGGECTDFVWRWFHLTQQIDLPAHLGNANQWITSAHREGWTVDQDPQVGKIAAWGPQYPPFGHVAVVVDVRSSSDFTVKEMNFTYMSADNAGRVDCRVPDVAPDGFITPSGAAVGGGGTTGNSILDALSAPFSGIAASIERAALYAQAELMTAEEKAMSVAMMGGGGAIMAAGGVLGALTVAGGGSPGAGYARLRSSLPQGRSGAPAGSGDAERYRSMTATERAWLRLEDRRRLEGE